jgi:glycerophosphoryl diester phosphodiesterase
MKRPLIIAHRGSSAHAPENTLAAFRQAMADGADGIEFDVRLAKDGVPVVIHDSSLNRLARKNSRVAELTSHELSQVDVGSRFNRHHPKRARPEFALETVPTLEAVFSLLKNFDGRIYLELKCRRNEEARQLADAVSDVIASSNILTKLIVQSFHRGVLPMVRERHPNIVTAAIVGPRIRYHIRNKGQVLDRAYRSQADRLSIHKSLAHHSLIELAAEADIQIAVWTVRSRKWIAKAQELGIDALITNDPKKLVDARDGAKR